MYLPSFNAEHDIPTLHALMRANPLGTWSAVADGQIAINHIPFFLRDDGTEFGVLVGHVARANPIWKTCDRSVDSVVAFHAEQAYISPSWYPSKQEHGKVVPTWNYAVVHAEGTPRFIEDKDWLRAQIDELTHAHENDFETPWKTSDAPEDYVATMLKGIVGVEIPLSSLTGKWKLGQNRSQADQQGMIQHLESSDRAEAIAMAARMREKLEK